jgi:hypothetical protein
MKSFRKLSIISAVLLLSVWILPVVVQAIPTGCPCCEMTECCCGCNEKEFSTADKDISKSTNCNCSISENSTSKEPFSPSHTIIKKHFLSFSKAVPEAQNSIQKKNKVVQTKNNSPLKFLSLFVLKSSFLL